jgi:hypothetical protein
MSAHMYENHKVARKDDVEATVSELVNSGYFAPLDANTAQNFKQNLTTILTEFYERAVAEGRYLEIMDPSSPPEPAVITLLKEAVQ